MEQILHTKAEVEQTEKGLLAIASTAVEDRHGEIVQVEGWDLKNFKKNPVLQWAHDHSIPAIGIAKNLRIEGEGKKAKLLFEPVFHEITDFAKAIKKMFEEGILKAFSVGFKPLEMDDNTYTKQELLEISAVNVPANQEALMLAYKTLEPFKKEINIGIEEKDVKEEEKTETVLEVEKRLEYLESQMTFVVKGLKTLNPHFGRESLVNRQRQLVKAIDKATSQLLADAKAGKPTNERLVKAIDKMAESYLKEK